MTRACALCGSSLHHRRRHARYCSGACRAAASRAHGSRPSAGPAQRPDIYVFPRDIDEFFAAVIAAIPGSYEELRHNDEGRVAARPSTLVAHGGEAEA